MKKIGVLWLFVYFLLACNPQDIKKTTDGIQTVDSLLNHVEGGMKSLDSITTLVNDSAKLNNEIRNIQKQMDENNHWKSVDHLNTDSLLKKAQKLSDNLKDKDIAGQLDTLTQKINSSEKPEEIIQSVTQLIKTATNKATKKEVKIENPEVSKTSGATVTTKNPIIQKANIEFETEDLSSSNSKLNSITQQYAAKVLSQKTLNDEGMQKQEWVLIVPYNQFDPMIKTLENIWGVPVYKEIASSGSDEVLDQSCQIKITLSENKQISPTQLAHPPTVVKDSLNAEQSVPMAIKKGWDGLSNVGLWLLPFWPLFLLGGVVWYFVAQKNKKSKEVHRSPENKDTNTTQESLSKTNNSSEEQKNEDEDLTKYMPK